VFIYYNVQYNVRPLSQERIPEAFPVVAFLDERVTPQQWSDYASTVVAANGQGGSHGIMTLQDRQSHIIGLSVYHIRPDLQRGRVLVIENFAVVTLIGAQQAASTLLAAMEELARDRNCACLAISLLDSKARRSPNHHRSQTGQLFKGAGFRLDVARLSKCFDPTAARHLESTGPGEPSESAQARH
jgi:hypothetical protein